MNEPAEFDGAHAALTKRVIAIFYKVAADLGFGFLESVYKGAMMVALEEARIRAQSEVAIPVLYRGRQIGKFYADIVVEDVLILELKAADEISRTYEAQLLHYLRSSHIEIGFVLAFGQRPRFSRIYMGNDRKPNLSHQ